ncbi:MAG: hypothetical protein AB7F72_17795 [Afipia sp.]
MLDLGHGNLGTATQSGFADTLIGFENFRTGSGNDWIGTNSAANVIGRLGRWPTIACLPLFPSS